MPAKDGNLCRKEQHSFIMGRSKVLKKNSLRKKQVRQQTKRLLQRAFNQHRAGKVAEAQKTYQKILSISPNNRDALGNLGLLLHSQGKTDQAVEYYQQALAESPLLDHLYYFLGNGLQEQGQHREAIVAYKKALAASYKTVDTLLQLGMAYADLGQSVQARECFEKILKQDPDFSQASYYLGLLAYREDSYQEAVDAFTAVLQHDAENIDASFNLALCYKALGQFAAALENMEKAAQLAPDDTDIFYNIGVLHKEMGEVAEAEAAFKKSLALKPDNGICLTDMAILYHSQNRLEEAASFYQQAHRIGFHPDSAAHMLAALEGQTTASAPEQYIIDLFDNYAATFDQSLTEELHYEVPQKLARIFKESCNKPVSSVLDLGCGTGLSGAPFRDATDQLIGVDLSEKMLAQAEKKQIYDSLYCRGITDFLKDASETYQLVIAADVFVYLGRLEAFFEALSGPLDQGGALLFSVERCTGADYVLQQSGRYAHSHAYIDKLAETFHFTIIKQEETAIRSERSQGIVGDLYFMQQL